MRRDLIIYAVSIVVIIAAFAAAAYLPVPAEFRGLITLPGLLGLFSLLAEAWRAQAAHERAIELQHKQQNHSLGIASHMAVVTFDRQVDFCEEYFEKVYEALLHLGVNGPTQEATSYGQALARLRMRYSPWLSMRIEAGLRPFEKALLKIGVDSTVTDSFPPGPDRSKAIERTYNVFQAVVRRQTKWDT